MVRSISKSTSLGRLGGSSSRQFSSSTSSLKSHSNPNHSQLTPSAKDAAHKSLKQDSLLRDAISLYHLSPSFYPVPSSSTSSSSSSSGAALSLSLTSRINSDFLSRFIPSSDSNSNYSYPKSTQSVRGGETTGNFKFQFPTISTLQNRQDSLQNRNVKDGYIFNSDGKALGSNSNSNSRKSNEDEIKALFNTRSSSSPSSSSSSSSTSSSTLSSRKGLNSTYQLTSIPSPSKGSGDRIITSPSLVAGSTSQNLASKDGNGLGLNNLDERGARIRDALFGTVSGGLPGLEIVRERKERRIRRLKEEGGEEEE